MRFSSLDAKELMKVANLILSNDPKGNKFIENMVNDIVSELKKQELKNALPNEDDEDDYGDVDLSDLGF